MCSLGQAQNGPSSQYGDANSLYSDAYATCMEGSGGVTRAMLECDEIELRDHDARLNVAYQDIMGTLRPAQRALLKEAQRTWIKYRDTTCSLMSNFGDRGTMGLLVDSGCLLEATAKRTRWLEDLLGY
jgi:uncharacterized protein YecT (DUF1311 family)